MPIMSESRNRNDTLAIKVAAELPSSRAGRRGYAHKMYLCRQDIFSALRNSFGLFPYVHMRLTAS